MNSIKDKILYTKNNFGIQSDGINISVPKMFRIVFDSAITNSTHDPQSLTSLNLFHQPIHYNDDDLVNCLAAN